MRITVLVCISYKILCILGTTDDTAESSERSERSVKRGIKRTIQDILSGTDECELSAGACSAVVSDEELLSEDNKAIVADKISCDDLRHKIKKLEKENRKLREVNEALKEKVGQMYSLPELENIFSSIFSKTQLNSIMTKKSVRHWPDEDVSAAFTLRSMSPKFYEYLRTKKGFPLPCKSTLNERAKNFSCEPGLLSSVLSIMKTNSDTLSELERLAVISLDEMSITSEWCYDKGNDTLYEPHDKVQVVMVSGIVGKWKQPVFYDFDVEDMLKPLMRVIKEVEHAGYPVVALVHDLGPNNIKMWKELGIDAMERKISFKNPAADRDVYVFADVPHLIKLIRNNFLDSGFYMKNGNYVSDSCIREMLTATKTEYGLAHKLSELHLNVSGQQRQRVKYAAQLLSNSCSNSLKYLGDRGLLRSSNWKETADLIKLVDEWFDVMNSSHKFGEKRSLDAFGVNLSHQTNILLKMIEVMSSMRVKDPLRKGLLMFQKGAILSSYSLIGLYNMLQESYKVQYILTRKLNQDCLEHLFGCIRQMQGSYDHPNAITMKFRLKKLLLGKDVALISEKTNTSNENFDCMSNNVGLRQPSKEATSFCERDLAVELYITSRYFKNLDVENEVESCVSDLYDECETYLENAREDENCKPIADVIEEESLRYIGGYIARKFCVKYPYLGHKKVECPSMNKTWIDEINRGELYTPAPTFFSHLSRMREIFMTVHGNSLKEGKQCFKRIVSDIESVGVDLPSEVIYFFAKISVFFRIRKLNSEIRLNIKKNKVCRSEKRKLMKMVK